jgi:PAS domain S-box-containing protein
MTFQTNPIALANLFTALLSLCVAVVCVYRKHNPGALLLAGLMGAITVWGACGMLEAAAVRAPDKILWSQCSYLGIVSAPVFWFLFASRYAHHDHWFPRWFRAGIWVFPAATFLVAITNPWHHFLWGAITPGPDPDVLVYSHNFWFWLHLAFSYILMLAGTVLLLLGLQRPRRARTAQSLLIILGALIPWIGNIIYIAGLSPILGLDLTPLVLVASGTLIAANILQFGLLDLVPMARDAVVEKMLDGIIVIDPQDRVVDINPAARALFPEAGDDFVGRPARSFFLGWPSLSERLKNSAESHAEILMGEVAERTMDVRASIIKNEKGKTIGRMVVLRDITTRVQMERALLEVQTRLIERGERPLQ